MSGVPPLMRSGLFAVLALSCGDGKRLTSPETHTLPSIVWGEQIVGEARNVPHNSTADIVDVGEEHFAVGYVDARSCVLYRYYDLAGKSDGHWAAGCASPAWIRANTSRSLRTPNCDQTGNDGFENYFVAQDNAGVYLDRIARCGQQWEPWSWWFVDSAAFFGGGASLASSGDTSDGKILIAVTDGAQLRGRFYFLPSRTLSGSFVIKAGSSSVSVTKSDAVYNRHADRFIVSWTETSRNPDTCRVWNGTVSNTFPPVVTASSTPHGWCDPGTGGHYHLSAYNPHGDGKYLSWFQANDDAATHVKNVFLMDTGGRASLTPLLQGGGAWTSPLASTEARYLATDIAYVGFANQDSSLKLVGFSVAGAPTSLQTLLPADASDDRRQVAVRVVGSNTAALTMSYTSPSLLRVSLANVP